MKLTVIGCHGPYALNKGEATSCYYVETKYGNFALDFGSGAMANLGKDRIKKLDYIFLSHLHFDHVSDLLPLRYLLADLGKSVTIITEKAEGDWYEILTNNPHFKVVNVSDKESVNIEGLTLTFFRTKHPVNNLGVRIKEDKTLVYTGDTSYYIGIENDVKDADLVLIDGVQEDGFKGPHLTSEKAIKLQEKVGGKFVLTHKNSYELVSTNSEISIAEEMAEYEV